MTNNEELIKTFYKAFQNKDYRAMQDCYADNAVFNDAIFKDLDSKQVKAMWEMLIKRGKDMRLTFKNIEANGNTASAEWVASYTFSSTNRKVINHVKANFIFENNKILKHTDDFNFYRWSRQALGTPGLLLGWTSYLKSKVSRSAIQGLDAYIKTRE